MRKRGFSLIEILVTLLIMTIILAITIPSQGFFLSKSKADIARLQLMRAINLTRSEAIERGQMVILCGSSDQHTCSDNWNNSYIILAGKNLLHLFDLPKNAGQLFWRAFPKHQHHLEYLPSGMINVENGTFRYYLPHENKPYWAIVINQSGRAREVRVA